MAAKVHVMKPLKQKCLEQTEEHDVKLRRDKVKVIIILYDLAYMRQLDTASPCALTLDRILL